MMSIFQIKDNLANRTAKQNLDKLFIILAKFGFIYTLYKHVVSDRISINKMWYYSRDKEDISRRELVLRNFY